MNNLISHISETTSTNDALREKLKNSVLPEGYTIVSDFQTTGRGQAANKWESERCKNLLFSTLFYPTTLDIACQFLLSEAIALGIKTALSDILGETVKIKWPNDIYWNNKKLCGILIETTVIAGKMEQAIVGIGINVNQTHFFSDAPNPVSMCQIAGHEFDRTMVLGKIIDAMLASYCKINNTLQQRYFDALYRNDGFYPFLIKATSKVVEAKLLGVKPSGILILQTQSGQNKEFFFKEIEFVN